MYCMTRLLPAARLKSLLSFKSMGAALLIAVTALMAGCGNETLSSISVGPPDATLAAGLTSQYVATGIYSDGTKKDLSSQVTWSSSTPAAAKISSSGLATAVSAGTTTITATLGTFSGTTNLKVTGVTLVSVEVTPTNPSIALGATEQFAATGVYSDNSTQNLTTAVTWNSATPGVATINTAGLATSVAAGSSVITASYQGVSGTTTLTVTAATLVSIGITPATATLASGLTQQFVAMGVYSDHSTHVLTTNVTWASSVPGTATISNAAGTNGLAKALAVGTTAITASLGGVTSPAVTLTVTAATLVSITVTPANPTLPKGSKLQFVATGTYTDNSTQNLTTSATWASSVPATATISNAAGFDGQATAVAVGTTAITATLGAVKSTPVTLTVTAAALASIAVTPTAPVIAKGLTQQFVAMGTYTDMTTQVLTTTVTWKSATLATATISNAAGSNGLATSVAAGTTAITATQGGITSPAVTLTVTAATLVSIAVTPPTTTIDNGLTQQFIATGTYSDTTTQVITTSVTWTSSNPATATISNAAGTNGLATSRATGTTSITAALGAIASPGVPLTVVAAALQYAYLTDFFHGLVWQYAINPATGLLTPLTPASVSTLVNPSGIAADPTGNYLYVANEPSNTLSQYTIGTGGQLTAIAGNPATGLDPSTITINGQYVYVANYNNGGAGSVAQYIIGTGGALTALTPATVAAGNGTGVVAFGPNFTSLPVAYVANETDGTIMVFTVSAGVLAPTPVFTTPVHGTAPVPNAIVIDSTGTYLYVSDSANNVIDQYSIDQTTGALTYMANTPQVANTLTLRHTSTAGGDFVYASDRGDNEVAVYQIGAGGALGLVGPTVPLVTGYGPNNIAFDASGSYAYVADRVAGNVSQYLVGGTGALTALAPPTAPMEVNSQPIYIVTTSKYP
jgi:6-phosphogluconolactonase (cycloisomerase 2 family)